MVCPKCNSFVGDGLNSCPNCGTPLYSVNDIPAASQQPYNPRAQIRQQEISDLNKMINYFSQVQDYYNEYDEVFRQLNPNNLRKRVGLLVWGIILALFGAFVALIPSLFGRDFPIPGLIIVGGALFMILGFILSTNARKKNYSRASARYNELSEKLYQHYLNYGYCPIGPEYTNPSNLAVILQTIQSGRADTSKDAINILVEDAYKYNMQAFARQAAVSSTAAAHGATVSAVFSAGNFFLR